MATTVWKGFISFGLVSVPVRLFSAARYSHIQFHEVHREGGHRVHQQLVSSQDNKVVERKDLALGYEADDGKMVIVEPSELRELEPPSSTTMEILQFVKLDQVDPIYFETSYFSVPEEAGRRGYALLLETMEQLKIAALAKVTLHRRERAVIIRPYESGLVLHTIYYPNEIHEVPGYGSNNPTNLKKQEIAMAEQFAKELICLLVWPSVEFVIMTPLLGDSLRVFIAVPKSARVKFRHVVLRQYRFPFRFKFGPSPMPAEVSCDDRHRRSMVRAAVI